ncbi:type II toxin-antitoxin system prevent-host-death family antitoxin [Corynebacterium jeddahense]|uniref:type II toxin-antitoxin system prevent-host-death family antitoxin n=1 Tax=Corynebacterium jeddahense TaxID=1414719 RepID=UPI0009450174|nr:type II toxin-antitoxin system prevent-host-death family antitoxin [Corynebacterium jeddahense]
MTTASLSEFRANQSRYIAAAQREPVAILSRGAERRAVLVSPELFDQAMQALEDQIDLAAAREAESEERVSMEEVREMISISE